jgi:hypothetical protein
LRATLLATRLGRCIRLLPVLGLALALYDAARRSPNLGLARQCDDVSVASLHDCALRISVTTFEQALHDLRRRR